MKTRRLVQALAWTGLLVLVAALLGGCLRGKARIAVRYDPAKDEFHFLTVYSHIRGGSQDEKHQYDAKIDLAAIKSLFASRGDLIIFEPIRVLGGPPTILRRSDHEYDSISLENGTRSSTQPTTTPVALSKIDIRPGTLFVDGEQHLGNYHEVVIPGRLIDEWLRPAPATEQELKDIDDLIARRRDASQKRESWDALAEQVAAPIREKGMIVLTSELNQARLLAYLETDSLVMLRAARKDNKLEIGRRGSVIYTRLPMTPADAKELKAAFDKVHAAAVESMDKLAEQFAKDEDVPAAEKPAMGQAMQACIEAFTAKPVEGGIEISIDLPAVANLWWYRGGYDSGDPQIEAGRAAEMARLVQAELPVAKDITADGIYRDFKAGTLRSYPASRPTTELPTSRP